jgi:hypothetical protein
VDEKLEEIKERTRWTVTANHPEHYPAPLNDERVLLTAKVPNLGTVEVTKLEDKRWLLENAPNATVFTIFWPGKLKSSSRQFNNKTQRKEWLNYIIKKYY